MEDYPGNPQQQLSAAWQAATSALGQWRSQVSAATSEAVEKLDPAVRSALEAARAAVTGNWGLCQCPCAVAHPADQGVCDHKAIVTRRVHARDMHLCAPCAVAQGVAEMPH